MTKQTALYFVDSISKYYKKDDLRINVEINKGNCVVLLRCSFSYRVPHSLIVCVQDLLCKGGVFGTLTLSVVRFNEELSVMVHDDDLFGNKD